MARYSPCWAVASFLLGALVAAAQESEPTDLPGPMVQLKLRGGIELQALIDYVGERLDISFIYEESIGQRTVNVRAPSEIPVDSLLDLLGSVLKMEGLILVDAETAGWMRIVDAGEMARLTRPRPETGARTTPATPVTQMFVLKSADPQQLLTVLRPFLTQPGGNTLVLQDSGVLIVTDYAHVVENVAVLIELLDQGTSGSEIRYYKVINADVEQLVTRVSAIFDGEKTKIVGEPRSGLVAVAGVPRQIEQVISLLQRFDVAIERSVQVYRFQNIQAERVQRILDGLKNDDWTPYTISADREANLMVVRATPEIHKVINDIISQLDRPTDNPSTPLRFYKLQNAKAIEVFFTLQALQELSLPAALSQSGLTPFGFAPFAPLGATGFSPLGGGFANSLVGGNALVRPNSQPFLPQAGSRPNALDPAQRALETTALPLPAEADTSISPESAAQDRLDQLSGVATSQLTAGSIATLPGGARVSVDIASNSLILVAPPEVHRMYEQIIKKLDVRRPQVLIESHIVAIDTSDQYTLGVEVSAGDRIGDRRLFNFTSFGLSEVDPTNGFLSLTPALGFNGALVDPDVADVIVQALVTHSRARVLSSPQLLVNDNSTGELESIASVPFSSVNASNTVSTTSLGGNQEAGTTLRVTPQINQGDHLQLAFEVEFSTFDEGSTAGALPPPRQIDRVVSQVTIPNGHTVIVGGLNRKSDTNAFSGVPWLEKIPIVREVSSLRSDLTTSTSFFLFIRPRILRDDRFRDLKHLSQKSVYGAGIQGDYPPSKPIMMK